MEGPGPAAQNGASLQDSVVGGNLHTGNVIHNHYHVTQTTNAVHSPNQQLNAPQPAVVSSRTPTIYVNPSGNPLGSDERNLVLAYIFCIFLGYFGAHRFYLGHVFMGILYFFTFGFFGLGWLIDLVILPDLVHARNKRKLPR